MKNPSQNYGSEKTTWVTYSRSFPRRDVETEAETVTIGVETATEVVVEFHT